MVNAISILGCTGSIGRQALEVIALHPDRFFVTALTAHKNAALLFDQVRSFRPRLAALTGVSSPVPIPDDLSFCSFRFGPKALEEAGLPPVFPEREFFHEFEPLVISAVILILLVRSAPPLTPLIMKVVTEFPARVAFIEPPLTAVAPTSFQFSDGLVRIVCADAPSSSNCERSNTISLFPPDVLYATSTS